VGLLTGNDDFLCYCFGFFKLLPWRPTRGLPTFSTFSDNRLYNKNQHYPTKDCILIINKIRYFSVVVGNKTGIKGPKGPLRSLSEVEGPEQ